MSANVPPLGRAGRVVALVAMATMLNCFPVHLAGGAQFLPGVLIVMPLVLVLPLPWAVAAASIALAPTFAASGRPFVLLLGAVESIFLASFGRRRSAVLVDILYWAVLGIPAGLLLYVAGEGLPTDRAAVLLLHYPFNALLAVLVADVVVRSTRFAEWCGAAATTRQTLRGLIFSWVFALAALPLVGLAFGLSVLARNAAVARDELHLDQAIGEVGRSIDQQLQLHRSAVELAAGLLPPADANATAVLDETRRTHPAFITMLATDAAGKVRAVSPAVPALLNTSVGDRPYFSIVRNTQVPVISGVFRGRGFGRDILVAIGAPRFDAAGRFAGIVEGSLEIHRFAATVSAAGAAQNLAIVIADSSGRVIFADPRTGLHALDEIRVSPLAAVHPEVTTVDLSGAEGRFDRVRARRGRTELGLTVIALAPAMVGLEQLFYVYLLLSAAVVAVLVLAGWVAAFASRRLAKPLEDFARDAVDQAESGEFGEMAMPGGGVPRDVTMVFAAFNCLVARVREIHAALAKTNEELDARVAARTRELETAQKQAEAANRSKTEFVAMTGHEIRTPLNAIIGLAEAAAEDVPRGPVAERLRTIRGAGARLLAVINDLLDLSRVEAGKLPVRSAPVELGALLRELKSLFETQSSQRGIDLVVDCGVALPLWIETDGARLLQVLVNLVGNALKFTREGTIRIAVAPVAVAVDKVEIRFVVTDSGPGIPEAEQARLFQPYVQLEHGKSEVSGGSGLGLAISRKLVELLGGSLAVRNAPVRGAEFYFSLTFRRATATVVAPTAEPATAKIGDLHVLVVDDNIANQEVLRAFLERDVRSIETFGSATEAIAALDRATFDVALVDLEMPDVGGAEVAAAVMGRRPALDCVVIAVSAHTADEKRAECLAQGFADFLPKPINRRHLLQMLSAIASKRCLVGR